MDVLIDLLAMATKQNNWIVIILAIMSAISCHPLSDEEYPSEAKHCKGSLGVSTPGLFPKYWMSSSDGNAFQGRLHYTSAWKSRRPLKSKYMLAPDSYAWIQVDLIYTNVVTGIITQGDPNWKNWVQAFGIEFSRNCKEFESAVDKEGNEMVFPGNIDSDSETYNVFPDVIYARCLRVVPLQSKANHPALRFELTGCEERICKEQLVSEDSSKYFPLSAQKLLKKSKTGLAVRRRQRRKRPLSRNRRTKLLRFRRRRRDTGFKFAEFSFASETIFFGLIIKGYGKHGLSGYFTVEYSRNCHQYSSVREEGKDNTPQQRFRFENKKHLEVTWHYFARPIRAQCIRINAFIFKNVKPSYSAKVNFIGCGTEKAFERQCGKHILSHSRTKRVIGGHSTELGHWPWLVSIQLGNDYGGYQHVCGGSLIDNSHVLTAAHCIFTMYANAYYGEDDLTNASRWNDKNFKKYLRVSVGEHNFDSDEGTSTFVAVKEVYTHPEYNISCYRNDVAVITLSHEVHLTDHVNPICLPEAKYNAQELIQNGVHCTVAGWGQITTGEFPSVPHYAELPLISNKRCNDMYTHLTLSEDMICAGPEDGMKDACVGDSGGPIMCEVDDQWVQIGMVSWNIGCAVPGYPGVYVNLQMFLDWINSKID